MRGRRIFEYRFIPGPREGSQGGYSVTLYSRGDAVKRDFAPDHDKMAPETLLAFMPDSAVKVRAIITRHAAKLKVLPARLDNALPDAALHSFTFGGKTIISRGILRTDIFEYSRHIPFGYEGFIAHRQNQNTVLDIYNEIAAEINRNSPGFHLPIL